MSQIQTIKEATDIVDVIGEKLDLKPAGSYLKAPCPFHSDGSPSFFVSPGIQRYKCFGCGEQGDIFTFLEKYDGMTFREALEWCASRANIELDQYKPDPREAHRKQILEVLNLAKEYYHYLLQKHKSGDDGRKYLKQRGTNADSIKLFQLGYAPNNWDSLTTYLHQKKGYDLEILEAAGLIIRKDAKRVYDRFRNRLIFPLRNHRGQVVGFSGRTLDPDAKQAKYINSPETLVYHKSQMLFGYSELYQQIRKANKLIITEGEFDVLSSVQAHVLHVCAIKGSALTPEHARLIKRTVDKVILALDTDQAGVEATKRALEVLQKEQLDVRVVVVSDGKDPDDLARSDPKAWRELTEKHISAYDFLIQVATAQHNSQTPEGKRAIIEAVGLDIATIPHAVEKDFYVKKLAELLQVKPSLVLEDLRLLQKTQKAPSRKSASQSQPEKNAVTQSVSDDELALLGYILHATSDERPAILQQVAPLLDSLNSSHITDIIASFQEKPTAQTSNLVSSLAEDYQQICFEAQHAVETILARDQEQTDWQKHWKLLYSKLGKKNTMHNIEALKQKLSQLDEVPELSESQQQEQAEYLRQLVQLQRTL